MADIDWTQPLTTLLHEGTSEAHENLEGSPAARALLSCNLPRDEYVRYIMMLWHVYDALEEALDKHATHSVLEPTYNPTLRRAPGLADDISYFLQVPVATWQSHPAHLQLQSSVPTPLSAYVARIRALANSLDPTRLLAHSYVRYLGDMSGGQIIRRGVAKAYDLDEADGLGLQFYEFKKESGHHLANQAETKRMRQWFQEGINTAGDIGVDVKAAVYDEANLVFDLNMKLFMALCIPPEPEMSKDEPQKRVLQKFYHRPRVMIFIFAFIVTLLILITNSGEIHTPLGGWLRD